MKQLTHKAFDRAHQFLKTQARPLDRVLFEYRFEDGTVEQVIEELTRFQNDDGGFGRALEPDMRTPSSSTLATGIGLRILKELQGKADHPLVSQAVQFLLNAFDEQTKVWRVVPPDANSFPHAPWWHDEDGSLARTFDDFLVIPRAEIVGLLHHFATLVPADWLNDVTEHTVTVIETIENLGAGGGDDLKYALNLVETEELSQHFRERVLKRIRAVVPTVVSRDPQEWTSYCITPLKLVESPQSAVVDLLADEVQVNLDYLIEHQTDEGTWEPTWTWGDLYPEVWEQAKLEWRGEITLHTLTMLKAFGRLAE